MFREYRRNAVSFGAAETSATTKMELLATSITGVDRMPISGLRLMPTQSAASWAQGTEGPRFLDHKITGVLESASKAYTLLCMVATNRTLCVPGKFPPEIVTEGRYSG